MTTTLPLIRIVDDDEELRNSQKMLLASLGWSVKTYESALAFLSDDELTRPGCLILDVRMPGMTGLELQQELMRREIKNISIIFLSAHGDIAMATHTMRHGAVETSSAAEATPTSDDSSCTDHSEDGTRRGVDRPA